MEQQRAVRYLVQVSDFQEEAHVALEFLRACERQLEPLHDFLFVGRERVRVSWVNRWEHLVDELVIDAVHDNGALLEIDLVKQVAILEVETRVLLDELAFNLELNDGHGLLNLDVQLEVLRRQLRIALKAERHARIVLVRAKRKRCERQDVDAIYVLEHRKVAIACAVSHHMRYAAALAQRGPHPNDVMIAPLYVERMEAHERVHDQMRCRTTVVNVADQMQMVDGEALDDHAHGVNHIFGLARTDNGVDKSVEISLLVIGHVVLVHQLFDDEPVISRDDFPHLRTRVFSSRLLAYLRQVDKRFGIPRFPIVYLGKLESHLLTRVVDERGERLQLFGIQLVAECVFHLHLDRTRAVAQDVHKRLVFTMDVRREHLGPFGKVQDRVQVDDLRRGFCRRRK